VCTQNPSVRKNEILPLAKLDADVKARMLVSAYCALFDWNTIFLFEPVGAAQN
jgi:hypothetical protein